MDSPSTPKKSNKRRSRRRGRRRHDKSGDGHSIDPPGDGSDDVLVGDIKLKRRDKEKKEGEVELKRMKRGVSVFKPLQSPKPKRQVKPFAAPTGFDLGESLREHFPDEPWGQFLSVDDDDDIGYTSGKEEESKTVCYFCFDRNHAKWIKLAQRKKTLKKELLASDEKSTQLAQKVQDLHTQTKDLISQARDRLSHALNDNKLLKTKCDELEKSVGNAEKIISSLNDDLRLQSRKVEELETQLGNDNLQQTTTLNTETKDLISQARKRLTKALEDNKILKVKCKDLEMSVDEKEKRVKYLDDDLQLQSRKADELAMLLGDAKVELMEQEEKSAALEKKVNDLNITTKALMAQARDRLSKALDENKVLKTKCSDIEKILDDSMKSTGVRDNLQSQSNDEKEILDKLIKTKLKLKEQEEKSANLEKQLNDLNAETKDLIAQARKRLTKALTENKALKTKCHDLESSIDKNEKRAKTLDDNLQLQSRKVEELALKLKDTEEKLRSSENENLRLLEELAILRAAQDELKQEKTGLQKKAQDEQRVKDETIRLLEKEKLEKLALEQEKTALLDTKRDLQEKAQDERRVKDETIGLLEQEKLEKLAILDTKRDLQKKAQGLEQEKTVWEQEKTALLDTKRDLQEKATESRLELKTEQEYSEHKVDSLKFDYSMLQKRLEAAELKIKLYLSRKSHYKSQARKWQKKNDILLKKVESLQGNAQELRDQPEGPKASDSPTGHIAILGEGPSKTKASHEKLKSNQVESKGAETKSKHPSNKEKKKADAKSRKESKKEKKEHKHHKKDKKEKKKKDKRKHSHEKESPSKMSDGKQRSHLDDQQKSQSGEKKKEDTKKIELKKTKDDDKASESKIKRQQHKKKKKHKVK